MTATDEVLFRLAGALCATSTPHTDADEDWPCSGCLLVTAGMLALVGPPPEDAE